MPNAIPNFQISNFLARHTIPLPIEALPSDSPHDKKCSICRRSYIDPPSTYVHPDFPTTSPEEYACQIRNNTSCRHIFGRHCLERHIRANQPWSHMCPMCRTEWFPAPSRGRTDILARIEDALNMLAEMEVTDENVRRQLDHVERRLLSIRDVLYVNRWV